MHCKKRSNMLLQDVNWKRYYLNIMFYFPMIIENKCIDLSHGYISPFVKRSSQSIMYASKGCNVTVIRHVFLHNYE